MRFNIEISDEEETKYREVILETLQKSETGMEDKSQLTLKARGLYEDKYGKGTSNPNKVNNIIEDLLEEEQITKKNVFDLEYLKIAKSSGANEETSELKRKEVYDTLI